MASDALASAVAANRDVPDAAPGPFQDCRDVVHISVFFDGTGNNKSVDDATRRWSNVARIFDAAIQAPPKATYRIYISGVGTPYNGKAGNWLSKAEVWTQDNLGGMGFGAGGDRRMEQGDGDVNDRLREVLIANASKMGGEVAQYAASAGAKSFEELNSALGKHRLIKMINLSVFGFSRGAALARAFSNRVLSGCKTEGGTLLYQGYPLRINFLGLFDTVASFGVPSQNARTPFSERDLIVSAKVERCVHFVAAHEVRFAFPVDLIRKDGKLAGEWIEKTYPGVHSDVGGGYEPKAQAIDNNYSRIPMRDMMREALLGGVRANGYEDIRRKQDALFTERFECRADTEKAYQQYMAECGGLGGTIETQMRAHLKVFYSANGTMHRKGIETPGERRRDEAKLKFLGPKGMAWEISKYRAAAKAGKWVRFADPAGVVSGYAQYVKPAQWQIDAWDKPASAGAVDFVSRYVHDSKVDFIYNLAEPFSYFRPRGVQESSNSIWQEGGNWISSKAKQVGDATGEAVDAGKAEVKKAADATAAATKKAADATAAAAKRAADATARAARQTADAARRKAQEAADYASRKAQETADYASRKAHEAADATGRAYQRAAKAGNEAIDAGKRDAHEVEEEAERIVESGTSWIKRAIKEVRDIGH
ncbi:MAG: DUF2235 domain-containing protein [Massilia sp.]